MIVKKNKVTDLANSECCGCGLCVSLCPKNCITLITDELGYLKPIIDEKECINCGLCLKKCIISSPEECVKPLDTFASVRNDINAIQKSSSGGIFAAVAEQIIKSGGFVTGCILDNDMYPRHVLVSNLEHVEKLYGSKYVQSYADGLYEEVNEKLKNNQIVLFSGTPCQVAAVKRYTNNPSNLITIELICHGVPCEAMFLSYLDMYDRKNIKAFIFRDKSQGWTFNNRIVYKSGKYKNINHRLSSYMTYFLEGETYRDSCYKCPYAKSERCADLSIGDFWGIVAKRPDLKKKINIENGVSCLLVNTEKGETIIKDSPITLYKVEYNDIKEGNEPLNHPSRHSDKRNIILDIWRREKKWKSVNEYWKKNDYKYIYSLWNIIPKSLQHQIRLILNKR